MGLSDLFSAADVILDASPTNKAGLFELLATEAAERTGLSRPEILGALEAREKLGSTALGKGAALPHAELRPAETPVVLFVRLRRPIDFDARDEEPVDLVFLVLWPAAIRKGLLPVMSEICRALREPQALRRLRRAATPEDIVQLVHGAAAPDAGRGGAPEET
ncbi:PTS sugar transporter subunit IIA [Azospirillum sp.]|uniref:PTS sugar transporter subunit IIA n=1 Tax=Azospirillum sp. TaxID=34012 RepID=UPI002D6E49FC|nr:PTS sugar transporter subunit IIA [Azospirillum sp.]HYD69201.1 PTS sugar transporter subunit IIA [Azospirillum sp.]